MSESTEERAEKGLTPSTLSNGKWRWICITPLDGVGPIASLDSIWFEWVSECE